MSASQSYQCVPVLSAVGGKLAAVSSAVRVSGLQAEAETAQAM